MEKLVRSTLEDVCVHRGVRLKERTLVSLINLKEGNKPISGTTSLGTDTLKHLNTTVNGNKDDDVCCILVWIDDRNESYQILLSSASSSNN